MGRTFVHANEEAFACAGFALQGLLRSQIRFETVDVAVIVGSEPGRPVSCP